MADRLICPQVNVLALDPAPHAFNEHVVAPCTVAVHRHADVAAEHCLGEHTGRELATLIGVHDIGVPVAGERLFQRLDGMHDVQRDCHAMRKDLATRVD